MHEKEFDNFVSKICLAVPKILVKGNFGHSEYLLVLGIDRTCILQINILSKTIRGKTR